MLAFLEGRTERLENGCWLWLGAKTTAGYGTVTLPGESKTQYVHRAVYRIAVGTIPEGVTIDHKCHDPELCPGGRCIHRACCNPEHLQLATHHDNIMRGNGISARQVRAIEERGGLCPHGHDAYVVNKHGYRYCAECHRIRQRELKRTRAAAKVAAGTFRFPGLLLSPEQRVGIVAEYQAGGVTYAELASRHGCSKSFICNLVRAARAVS